MSRNEHSGVPTLRVLIYVTSLGYVALSGKVLITYISSALCVVKKTVMDNSHLPGAGDGYSCLLLSSPGWSRNIYHSCVLGGSGLCPLSAGQMTSSVWRLGQSL